MRQQEKMMTRNQAEVFIARSGSQFVKIDGNDRLYQARGYWVRFSPQGPDRVRIVISEGKCSC